MDVTLLGRSKLGRGVVRVVRLFAIAALREKQRQRDRNSHGPGSPTPSVPVETGIRRSIARRLLESRRYSSYPNCAVRCLQVVCASTDSTVFVLCDVFDD